MGEGAGIKFEPTINEPPDLFCRSIEEKWAFLVIETKREVPFIDCKFDP